MDNEHSKKPQYVGLCRRIFAYALDGLFYFSIIGLGHVWLDSPSSLFGGEEMPAKLVYYYLAVLGLFLFDQIGGPVLFGTTVVRWICGYRVQRQRGGNPPVVLALARFFSLWLIETVTMGILTFISSLIRRDRAAIHDIVSRTNAFYPEKRHSYKKTRTGLTVLISVLFLLISLNAMVQSAYGIFVDPVKARLLEDGARRYPETIANEDRSRPNAFRFERLEFARPEGIGRIEVCEDNSEPDVSYHVLTIDDIPYYVFHYEYDFDTRFPYKGSSVMSMLRAPLSSGPLFKTVERTFHNGELEFPLWTPWDNAVNFTASIYYAVTAPVSSTVYAIKGKNSYTLISTPPKKEYAALQIYVFFENDWETYDIITRKQGDASRNLLREVAATLHVVEKEMQENGRYPLCKERDR